MPTPLQGQDTSQGQLEFNRFEFRVFLLQDWLPYQSFKSPVYSTSYLFLKENNWLLSFSKVISAM